jgi:hypothetical protein
VRQGLGSPAERRAASRERAKRLLRHSGDCGDQIDARDPRSRVPRKRGCVIACRLSRPGARPQREGTGGPSLVRRGGDGERFAARAPERTRGMGQRNVISSLCVRLDGRSYILESPKTANSLHPRRLDSPDRERCTRPPTRRCRSPGRAIARRRGDAPTDRRANPASENEEHDATAQRLDAGLSAEDLAAIVADWLDAQIAI